MHLHWPSFREVANQARNLSTFPIRSLAHFRARLDTASSISERLGLEHPGVSLQPLLNSLFPAFDWRLLVRKSAAS